MRGGVLEFLVVLVKMRAIHCGTLEVGQFSFLATNSVGSRVKAMCFANEDSDLKWYKNGLELLSENDGLSLRNLDDALVLSIPNVQSKHSGNYTCRATNQGGRSEFSAVLVVNAEPSWLSVPRDITLTRNSKTEVECKADGFPEPFVTWSRNGGEYS